MADLLRQWLTECSYEGILFPGFECSTTGGHHSVQHRARGRPGADIETLGRKVKPFKIKAGFFDNILGWPSDLFPNRYQELMDKFDSTPLGTLRHPLRGFVDVHVDDWEESIDAKSARNGLYIDITFSENNASATFDLQSNSTATDPATEMEQAAVAVDEAQSAYSGSETTGASEAVGGTLAYLEGGDRGYAEAASSIGTLQSNIDQQVASLPDDDVEAQPIRAAFVALKAAIFRYADSYIGNSRPRQFVVPVMMSVQRIAAHPSVYGDARKASKLIEANRIADPCFVPAGTSLLILPE